MQNIQDKSIDMVLCDLPYGMTDCKWDEIIPFDELWKQYNRIVKDNGAVVLFSAQPFTTKVISSNLKNFKYCWYWVKPYSTGYSFAKYQPMRRVEDICVFYVKQGNKGKHNELRQYFFDELNKSGLTRKDINKLLNNTMSSHYFTYGEQFSVPSEKDYKKLQSTGFFKRPYNEIKKEYSRKDNNAIAYYPQGVKEVKNAKPKRHKRSEMYGGTDKIYTPKWTNYPTNILNFDREHKNRLHPTQKPVELLEYLIKTYTREGETVLDNCMGSGSTGEACIRTGRKFIGIEKEYKYFEIAKERINGVIV